MAERGGFSVAAVVLSYFLVAGGLAIGLILLTLVEPGGEPMFYGALALGGAIGGFVAARASRSSTVTEPALGGLLVIATIVAVFVGTGFGELVWHVARAEITRLVAIAGTAAAAGAIAGAFVSERLFGAHSKRALVWLVHVAFAVLGACTVAFVVLLGVMMRGETGEGVRAGAYLGAMGIGALLSGIAAGASAPRRILLVSLFGSIAGVMGFYLIVRGLPGTADADGKAAAGFAIIGAGCGVVTLIGAAIGWAAVGKRASAR